MSAEDMVRLSYKVNSEDFAKAGDASSNTKKVLKKLGIPSDIIRRAAVATYEAEMNIIIHSKGGEVTVKIWSTKIEITARITVRASRILTGRCKRAIPPPPTM